MSDYKMKKYPVVSSEGNEYFVDIKPCRLFVDTTCVEVFSVYTKRGFFGKERKKRRSINVYCYDEKSYEYDYVLMARKSVEKVDASMKQKREEDSLREKAISLFEEWDGKEVTAYDD